MSLLLAKFGAQIRARKGGATHLIITLVFVAFVVPAAARAVGTNQEASSYTARTARNKTAARCGVTSEAITGPGGAGRPGSQAAALVRAAVWTAKGNSVRPFGASDAVNFAGLPILPAKMQRYRIREARALNPEGPVRLRSAGISLRGAEPRTASDRREVYERRGWTPYSRTNRGLIAASRATTRPANFTMAEQPVKGVRHRATLPDPAIRVFCGQGISLRAHRERDNQVRPRRTSPHSIPTTTKEGGSSAGVPVAPSSSAIEGHAQAEGVKGVEVGLPFALIYPDSAGANPGMYRVRALNGGPGRTEAVSHGAALRDSVWVSRHAPVTGAVFHGGGAAPQFRSMRTL